MTWRQNVGMISQGPLIGEHIEWTIVNYFSLPQTADARILSPEFSFENQTCCLGVWPCIKDKNGTDEWIGVYFWIKPKSSTELDLNVKLGIKCHDGKEYKSCSVKCFTDTFQPMLLSYEQPELLLKSEFMNKVNLLSPFGRLTIFCELRKKEAEDPIKTYDGPFDILAC